MTAFPSDIIPSTRTYSPGQYPHTPHRSYGGRETRVRHSNTVLGVRLRLFFRAISTAELIIIRDHYASKRGQFLPFAIPADLLSGMVTPADFTTAGQQWVYAARPQVVDIPIEGGTPSNRHDLTIELETVPPENTIVAGARIRVRATVYGGSAQLGALVRLYASVVGGVAESFSTGGNVTATVSVVGGAASAGGVDPYFSDVALLLQMQGTNGSPAFTDSSSFARTISVVGNTQHSTAQFKWGTSSGLFDGTGDRLTATLATAIGTSDFCLEAWVYISSRPAACCLVNVGDSITSAGIAFYSTAAGRVGVFSATQINVVGTTETIPTGAWCHVALTKASGTVRMFVDGVLDGTGSHGGTLTADIYLGQTFYNSLYFDDLNGYVGACRITVGQARYTANFTPPTAAFPTS
jgi:hypothetical protein